MPDSQQPADDSADSTPLDVRREALAALIPEAFKDNELDVAALIAAIGLEAPPATSYGLSWPGKSDAIALLRESPSGQIAPDLGTSEDFHAASHALVVGDNLHVLRHLYRSYASAVDLVYIDPPYNTGKDRVYRDTFRTTPGEYLLSAGELDAESGAVLAANPRTAGRFHSAWLTMMYPRLFLAHELLADDGILMVSIDHNEAHNLRHLLDEIFGEQNFIAELVWDKTRKNDAKLFSIGHEYLLVYARSLSHLKQQGTVWREPKPGAAELWEQYVALRDSKGNDDRAIEAGLRAWQRSLPEKHPARKLARYKQVDAHGPWRDRDISWPGGDGPRYDVIHPGTGRPCKVPDGGWRFSKPEEMQRQIDLGLVVFREDETEPPFRKAHLKPVAAELDEEEADGEDSGEEEGNVGMQVMPSILYAQAQVAVKHLKKLFGDRKVFDNPKDHEVLRRLFGYVLAGKQTPLILDFFGGSGSTAEAVLRANEEGLDWRFLLVQLDETTPARSGAAKAGFSTIAQVTAERIRRVRAEIGAPTPGVRIFRHVPAAALPPDRPGEDQLREQLEMATGGSDEPLSPAQIWTEALRQGLRLDAVVTEEDDNLVRISSDGSVIWAWKVGRVPPDVLEANGIATGDVLVVPDAALDDGLAANLAPHVRLISL